MLAVFFSDQTRYVDFKTIIKNLPKNSIVIFREYHLESFAREKLALEFIKICRSYKHKILIAKNLALALKLKADGVHFSDFDKLPLQLLSKKNRQMSQFWPKNFIFSIACHNYLSVLKSQRIQADMIFISPILTTKTHPQQKNLGWLKFAKIFYISKKEVLPLGGMDKNAIKMLKRLDIKGFGGIDIFVN